MIYQSPIGIKSYQTMIVFCLHHNVLSPHGRKQATWTLWKQVQCGYYGIAIEALDPIHHLKNVVSWVLTNFTRGCCFNYKFYPLRTWGNPMKPKVRMKNLWMTSLDTYKNWFQFVFEKNDHACHMYLCTSYQSNSTYTLMGVLHVFFLRFTLYV